MGPMCRVVDFAGMVLVSMKMGSLYLGSLTEHSCNEMRRRTALVEKQVPDPSYPGKDSDGRARLSDIPVHGTPDNRREMKRYSTTKVHYR